MGARWTCLARYPSAAMLAILLVVMRKTHFFIPPHLLRPYLWLIYQNFPFHSFAVHVSTQCSTPQSWLASSSIQCSVIQYACPTLCVQATMNVLSFTVLYCKQYLRDPSTIPCLLENIFSGRNLHASHCRSSQWWKQCSSNNNYLYFQQSSDSLNM